MEKKQSNWRQWVLTTEFKVFHLLRVRGEGREKAGRSQMNSNSFSH